MVKLDPRCAKCKRESKLFREFCNGLLDGAYFIGACEAEKQKARQRWLKENAREMVLDEAEAK